MTQGIKEAINQEIIEMEEVVNDKEASPEMRSNARSYVRGIKKGLKLIEDKLVSSQAKIKELEDKVAEKEERILKLYHHELENYTLKKKVGRVMKMLDKEKIANMIYAFRQGNEHMEDIDFEDCRDVAQAFIDYIKGGV